MAMQVNTGYSDIAAVTPDNDATLENAAGRLPTAVVASVSGTLAVLTADNRTITIPALLVVANVRIPVTVRKVLATGTTATGIHVLYSAN